MNLTSPSQVKAWCIENEFHPNKVLGQNFLIDRNALEAIVDAGLEGLEGLERFGRLEGLDGLERPTVLEIGPGLGVLTEEMLRRGVKVVAIEKDPVLADRLKNMKRDEGRGMRDEDGMWDRLTVISGDALDYIPHLPNLPNLPNLQTPKHPNLPNLPNLQTPEPPNLQTLPTCTHMVSNLPYQAGTRILLELCKARTLKAMTVLVQTEVAERLAAAEGSKTRGLAGVWAQLDYDVRIVRKVSASCFWPRPEIGSSVVRLDRHDRNLSLSAEERKLFFRLTKQAFEHRRKQLGSIFKDLIQSTARAEQLSNDDWITLVRELCSADRR